MSAAAVLNDASAEEVDANAMLQNLQDAGLLATGRVNLISVDAVRQAFGDRWKDRKARVWGVAETQIGRRIGDEGYMARLNDETYIIVTPTLDPLVARGKAVRVLREILTHFLGDLKSQDITVRVASQYQGGQLICRPLSTEEVEAVVDREPAADEADGGARAGSSLQMTRIEPPKVHEIITQEGRRLRFSVSVDPLIDLTKGVITAHRVEPKISYEDTRELLTPAARRRLMPVDVQEVDVATLERALTRLEAGESVSDRPSLLVSVSFLTLTNARARARFLAAVSRERDLIARSVMMEITDFDMGVPKGRLQEAASLLRPFCRAVFARDEPGSSLVKDARSLGVSGLVYEPPAELAGAEETVAWLINAGRVTAAHNGPRVVVNLSSTQLASTVGAVGFSHTAIRAR